jgi:hypothetical protein
MTSETPRKYGFVTRTQCWGFSSGGAPARSSGETIKNVPAGIRLSLMAATSVVMSSGSMVGVEASGDGSGSPIYMASGVEVRRARRKPTL